MRNLSPLEKLFLQGIEKFKDEKKRRVAHSIQRVAMTNTIFRLWGTSTV